MNAVLITGKHLRTTTKPKPPITLSIVLAPTAPGKFLPSNNTENLLWPLLQRERGAGGHRRTTDNQELNLRHLENHLAMTVSADCHGAFATDG